MLKKETEKQSLLLGCCDNTCFELASGCICKTATATSAQTACWPLDRSGHGALINADICRLTKHILYNGAMKAGAKSVYFEPGCEKLACETLKSLDSSAAPNKNES